jgi:aryl-alcohol dehydrogenase-like predicted oxidoreductase
MKRESEEKNNNTEKLSRRNFLKTSAIIGAGICIPTAANNLVAQTTKSEEGSNNNGLFITKHRVLGTGTAKFEVSALGFGCMGMSYNRGVHPDKKALIRLLHQAVDYGVTLFDTAEVYGPFINEELAGEALSPYKNKVYVTTKFGHDIVNGKGTGKVNSRPEHIRKVAEESLKRLRIDSIPLFYQHRYDPNTPVEDVAGAIGDLIKEGKVQRWGLCEVSADIIRRAHAALPLTAIQSEYHLMWRLQEEQTLPLLEQLGIGFVPYSPINRGFLGGTLNEYTKFGQDNDNRAALPRFTPEAMRANYRIVEALNTFGRTRGITSAQIALAWLLSRTPWIVPIPGTAKISHLEENLRSAAISFTDEEWKELESEVFAIPIIGDRYNAEEQKKVNN